MKSKINKAQNQILGTITGIVQKGRGEGQDLGFRTANLELDKSEVLVDDGVYAAYASVGGKTYKAAVSVGVSPVFKDKTISNVEAHLIDFDEDIYGKTIEIELVKFLRPMIKFASLEELVRVVNKNIEQARALL